MRSEFEKHFLNLKFATEGSAQRCLDSCAFDPAQDAYLPDVNWISDNDMDECVIYCCMLNTTYISFKDQQTKVDELQSMFVEKARTASNQQAKVDELQKQNSWLRDVAKRENKRANKLQEEKVSTTTLLGKTIQEKNELQKRLDAAIYLLTSIKAENDLWGCDQVERQIELLEQALNGGNQ